MAAIYQQHFQLALQVSTHSHPKVAAIYQQHLQLALQVSTHSHPKVAARIAVVSLSSFRRFQHTATRRWLQNKKPRIKRGLNVSTHSHPKVAANALCTLCPIAFSFNTQPPEGGCMALLTEPLGILVFQHTATRRWLQKSYI